MSEPIPPSPSLDATPLVNRENPWPGLSPFEEGDREFFFGRETEVAELARLVKREKLTVLFAKSGLGKTSLLRAGLMPQLRQEEFLPVYLRLDHSEAAPGLVRQIKEALTRALAEEHVDARSPGDDETLWEYFHREDSDFWSTRNRLLTPVFIFDQFEELFTLGRQNPAQTPRVEEFLDELECLVEGRAPPTVKTRFEADPAVAAAFDFDKQAAKVVLSLREDFLADLEGLRERLRSIAQNRFRVRAMNGVQALEVVLKPAAGLVNETVAAAIVDFVSSSRRGHGSAATREELTAREVEPALLSVVCRELNNRRRKAQQSTISADLLTGSKDEIIQDLYKRGVAGLDSGVQTFIEDELLTGSGFRKPAALEDALKAPGVTPEAVRTLVNRRLLRQEETAGVMWIELTHDLLTEVVLASRNERRQRETQAAAAEREKEIKRKLAASRRVLARVRLALVIALVCAGIAFLFYRKASQAEAAAKRAEADANKQRGLASTEAQKAKQISSRADFEVANLLFEQSRLRPEKASEAVAHLVRALETQPDNLAALLRLYSALTQRAWPLPVGEPMRHSNSVTSAQFSQDSRRVLTVAGRTVRVWNAETGTPISPPLRHEGEVSSAQFSPDGRWVLTTAVFTAQIWETETGNAVGKPIGGVGSSMRAQFSPDGQLVVTMSPAKIAQIWDAHTGNAVSAQMKHRELTRRGNQGVASAQFSPDGRWVMTLGEDNFARIWDAQTGTALKKPMQTGWWVESAQFSPDGRWVVTFQFRGIAQIWETETGNAVGQPIAEPTGKVDSSSIESAQFSPDASWVLTTSSDGTAQLWDSASGARLGPSLRYDGKIRHARFSPDGRWIVTTSDKGSAQLWEARTGSLVGNPMSHHGRINSALFSPDGHWVLTTSDDYTAQVWDGTPARAMPETVWYDLEHQRARFSLDGRWVLTASEKTAQIWEAQTGRAVGQPMAHEGAINSAQFSPDGKWVLTAADNTARLWEAQTGRAVGQPMAHEGAINSAQFSPDGKRVMTAADNTARVWEAQTGTGVGQPMAHEGAINSAQFSLDGTRVFTVSHATTARVWDAQTGRAVGQPLVPEGAISIAQFSPDGKWLLVMTSDYTARVWEVQTGRAVGESMAHGAPITSAQFSPDGKWLLTAAYKTTARVWDAQTGRALSEPIGHNDNITGAQFSRDGRWVVTASEDETVRLWEARTGIPVGEPLRHDYGVKSAELSSDGRRLLTVAHGAIQVWDLNPFGSSPPTVQFLKVAMVLANTQSGGIELQRNISPDEAPVIRRELASLPEADPGVAATKWLLADPSRRTINPFSTKKTVPWVGVPPILDIDLKDFVRRMPDHPLGLCRLAVHQMEATNRPGGGWFYADPNSRRAIALAPEKPEVWLSRSWVLLLAGGKSVEATEAVEKACVLLNEKPLPISEAHSFAIQCANLSAQCLSSRQYAEAAKLAEAGLKLDPTWTHNRINQARSYLFLAQFEKARALYLGLKQEKGSRRGTTLAQEALEELEILEKSGITHPDIEKIRLLLKSDDAK